MTGKYKSNKQQRKARLSGIIKGFVREVFSFFSFSRVATKMGAASSVEGFGEARIGGRVRLLRYGLNPPPRACESLMVSCGSVGEGEENALVCLTFRKLAQTASFRRLRSANLYNVC